MTEEPENDPTPPEDDPQGGGQIPPTPNPTPTPTPTPAPGPKKPA